MVYKRGAGMKKTMTKIIVYFLYAGAIFLIFMNGQPDGGITFAAWNVHLDVKTTVMIYFGMMGAIFLLHFFVGAERRFAMLFCAPMIPLGIYFWGQYGKMYPILHGVAIALFVIFTFAQIVQFLFAFQRLSSKKRKKIAKRMTEKIYQVCIFLISGLMVFYSFQMYIVQSDSRKVLENPVAESNADETRTYDSFDNFWDDNKELFLKFKQENYDQLSVEEKKALTLELIEIETIYLGIQYEGIVVEFMPLEGGTQGYYTHGEKKIVLDIEGLSGSSSNIINNSAHEIFHAYQHAVVDYLNKNCNEGSYLKFYRDASHWSKEMNDYKKADDDSSFGEYMDYYTQELESGARNFASDFAEAVYRYIELLEERGY